MGSSVSMIRSVSFVFFFSSLTLGQPFHIFFFCSPFSLEISFVKFCNFCLHVMWSKMINVKDSENYILERIRNEESDLDGILAEKHKKNGDELTHTKAKSLCH